MPPSERSQKIADLLNPVAAAAARAEGNKTVQPSPADPDMDGAAFESESYRFAADWLVTHSQNLATARPFLLIFSRSITTDEANLSSLTITSTRYTAFKSQKLIPIEGCMVIATMNLEQALVVPVDNVSTCQTLFEAAQNAGVGDRYMAAFEPAPTNLILLRKGAAGPSRAQQVKPSGTQSPWSLQEMEAQIEQFHRDQTRTPSGILEPWASAADGLTGEKLEIRISKALAHQLSLVWQDRGAVLAEASTSSGRMDIYVTTPVLVSGAGPCVIEVKVIRTERTKGRKFSPNLMEKWALKGVIQADEYRKDKCAPTAYLCCFDARDNDSKLPAVDGLAAQKNVQHRKYYMYRTADGMHTAVLTEAASASSL